MSSTYSCPYRMDPKDFDEIKELPGNKKCIECGKEDPEWASVSLGVLFCLQCSGAHRGLGTHISFVRSVTMDSWSESQIAKMKAGGNDRCNQFLSKHGIDTTKIPREKYDTPAAQLYQQVIKSRVDGTPEPTELPKPTEKVDISNRTMAGFGSAPPPPKPRGMERIKNIRNLATGVVVSVATVAVWNVMKK